MKYHIFIPIALIAGGLLSATLALRPTGEQSESELAGLAVIYQSRYELPSYSGGSSSLIMVNDLPAPTRGLAVEQSSNGVSFAEIEFQFSIVENKSISIDYSDAAPSSGDIAYGSFRVPRKHCSVIRILYRINQDALGFYLARNGESQSVRHRFESKDEYEIMWEVDRVISAKMFPSDASEIIASRINADNN